MTILNNVRCKCVQITKIVIWSVVVKGGGFYGIIINTHTHTHLKINVSA